uniref:Chromatin assembly factor 1 subunit p150 C-terminal domain-containing protein n=1 Tax=Colobus angolensis palliatus TaxID=336983 RepID=A0A2K5IKE9_COLAP
TDCKDRPAFPVKKLIQARLPFKRLNLVPKGKDDDMSDDRVTSVQSKSPDLEASLDTLENDCHMGSDIDLRPKLVNGKGPLDNFLGNRVETSVGQSPVIIDLTEDSNEQPDSLVDHNKLSSEASPSREAVNGDREDTRDQQGSLKASQNDKLAFPGETLSNIPYKTEEEGIGCGGAGRRGDSHECSPQSCLELTSGLRLCSRKEQDSWSKAGGILFRGKVPMVVLQDILAVRPPQTKSPPATPQGKDMTPESEVLESCPEEDSVLSHSSLSSPSSTSSPEGPPAPTERHSSTSPFPTSTPVRRITKKFVKGSTEKNKLRLQRAKLEEKRKKEEEKRLREEEKRIKAEKAEITRFFQKPKTPQAPKTLAGSCGKFAPFEIKEHMVLAPRRRTAFHPDLCSQLDRLLQQQSSEFSFLKDLKGRRPLRSGPTQVSTRNADIFNSDVVIVERGKGDGIPERRKFGRMKLLQFCENHRPAYWGTWNKKTVLIRARDPWAQDTKLLDYEVDSDEEWEEEEPGESLSHSEGDDDDDMGEDEDEDDGFFVPHGYLSEDEGVTEECADPENHKVRQKLKAKEWDEFLAKGKRFRVLQPVKIGCVWAADRDCAGDDLKVLQQFAACFLETMPVQEEQTPKASKTSKRENRDQQILAQLLPLLHGNVNGSKVIIREFQEHCRRGLLSKHTGSPPSPSATCLHTTSEDTTIPSKSRLKRLISENSVYEKRPDFRMCWYVHPQVLQSFQQEHLPVPCQWSYVTSVPSAPREDSGSVPSTGPSQGTSISLKRKSAGSMCITQFMKKRRHDGQVGAEDMDGFQADTEEEEEEEGDCMIVDVPDATEVQAPCGAASGAGGGVGVDTSKAALPASPLGAS